MDAPVTGEHNNGVVFEVQIFGNGCHMSPVFRICSYFSTHAIKHVRNRTGGVEEAVCCLEDGLNDLFVGTNGFPLRVESRSVTVLEGLLARTGPPTGFTRTRRRRDGLTPRGTG